MPKLPPIAGRDLVRVLQRLGFEQAGQRGSHVKLRRADAVCVVPLHDPIKKGTLAGILRQAKITADDLRTALLH